MDKENSGSEQDKGGKGKDWPAGDLILALALIAYSALMAIGALNFRWNPRMGIVTSPAFTPILLSVLVTLLSCALIVDTLVKYGRVSLSNWFKGAVGEERMKRSFVLIIITAVYVVLTGRISFFAVTTVYLFAMFWYLRIGNWKMIVLYSLLAGAAVAVFIPYIFRMPLP